MQFPKYTSLGFSDDVKESIAKVLQDTKPFLWDGKKPIEWCNDNVKKFICHAVEELYDSVDYTFGVSLGTVIRFIQANIDNSMSKSHRTFACWHATIYGKAYMLDPNYNQYIIDVQSSMLDPNYDQYIIDVQSHRKAWIDYLIQNLKETQNENK